LHAPGTKHADVKDARSARYGGDGERLAAGEIGELRCGMDGDKIHDTAETLLDLQRRGVLPEMRVESFGNQIIMLAGTRWEHNNIVDLIREQIPRPLNCKLSNVDLLLTSERREPIPDLVIVPEKLGPGEKPWAHETELLVEVVSDGNFKEDYGGKARRYAASGAPQYLLVDPREGICILHTDPDKRNGTWVRSLTFSFGDPISDLLCMDGADLNTSEFPRYT
jgi:Uma2 family endonuclease